MGLIFTVVSLVRSYLLRRFFNALHRPERPAEVAGFNFLNIVGSRQATRYTRPLPSTFSEVTSMPSFFLSAPAIAPRTVWACH